MKEIVNKSDETQEAPSWYYVSLVLSNILAWIGPIHLSSLTSITTLE